ncbi:hypothetical protein G7Y89_g13604 [Cudoniella acicularis]|uniref:Uncharacterized protein n=1 Tax=Cudoniella acicularis TaxID=354080 RepID=A0A8H4R9B5_9HELO|nr:hypothetical protein G7Y89_g13604 [Cudoniella acicularis]
MMARNLRLHLFYCTWALLAFNTFGSNIRLTNTEWNVTAGHPFIITWANATGAVQVVLDTLETNSSTTIENTLNSAVTDPSYTWNVSSTIAAGTYELEVACGGFYDYSPTFEIAGASSASSSTSSSRATASTPTTGSSASSASSSSDSNNSSPTPSSTGLASGTKVAIGVGVTVGALVIIALIALGFFLGRKSAANKAMREEETSPNIPDDVGEAKPSLVEQSLAEIGEGVLVGELDGLARSELEGTGNGGKLLEWDEDDGGLFHTHGVREVKTFTFDSELLGISDLASSRRIFKSEEYHFRHKLSLAQPYPTARTTTYHDIAPRLILLHFISVFSFPLSAAKMAAKGKKFSWMRLINNAVPNFARDSKNDVNLSPQQADTQPTNYKN